MLSLPELVMTALPPFQNRRNEGKKKFSFALQDENRRSGRAILDPVS